MSPDGKNKGILFGDLFNIYNSISNKVAIDSNIKVRNDHLPSKMFTQSNFPYASSVLISIHRKYSSYLIFAFFMNCVVSAKKTEY